MIKIIAKSILVLCFFSVPLYAQQETGNDTSTVSAEIPFQMAKSPWGAVARSAIIPGWGQFYNEDYLHIPVIWGLLGWFGYQWVVNNNDYKDNSDLYKTTGISIYKLKRDFYRDQRDEFTIYMILTYLMNLVDAFVGAHLFDFSVEEDYFIQTIRLKVLYRF